VGEGSRLTSAEGRASVYLAMGRLSRPKPELRGAEEEC
jgi:hypothetical protein